MSVKNNLPKIFRFICCNAVATLLVLSFCRNSEAYRTFIDDRLIDAVSDVESSNNPAAFKKDEGARGLTQVRPEAWDDLVRHFPGKYGSMKYERDIFKPAVARQAARDYLNILCGYLRQVGIPVTLDNLMSAYNWGVGNVVKYGPEKVPPGTKQYVKKIARSLQAK